MAEKITEDMRIAAEIETLTYAQLVEYAVAQQEKMAAVLDDPEASAEQIRVRNRLPRKRALFAAKKLFAARPETYAAYVKQLNGMSPAYLTNAECEKYGLGRHAPQIVDYSESIFPRREVIRFGFLHRQRN